MSIFLDVPPSRWIASNEHAFAILDQFYVSPGHALVITKQVVPDWFSATEVQRAALIQLVDVVKQQLDARSPRPDGYNVGFNAGPAAGQTVMHLHIHVIPRFKGDMDDPSGGVRHAIPSKGNYRRKVNPLASGGMEDPFSRHIFPLFNSASEIAIVAAFVQETGLDLIEAHVRNAIARGATVRILTGDYLDITQASALELLLSWERTTRAADDDATDTGVLGRLEARIIEVERLPGLTRAFHPKAWRFEAPTFGIAFVGSSNLSRSALQTGIEWNLRVDRDRDSEAYVRVREAFEALWQVGRQLDDEWIARYADRARANPHPLPPGESEAEPLTPPPAPHLVQVEALAKLRAARAKGRRRALVVLATGLGKTWLAAFDHQQLAEEIGARPRLLFLAHRKELLIQAERTFRREVQSHGVRPRTGWFLGDESNLSADLVFASVAKLSRPEHVARLAEQRFDYVVVDEVHHASAKSYRTILNALEKDPSSSPRFILGLTATPDRADAADILGLFDDHLAYSAGVERGVELKRLVPFDYFGVKDEIDYDNIPWRNRRFDPETLATLAQTEARMSTMWRAWGEHPGTRTLIFCCSIAHANFVRHWLTNVGVRTRAVYSGEGSDDRDEVLRELESGAIDAVCSVDVFNEGIDVPSIDRVVMLRPTESGVIFLQQLGRGLRASPGKRAVTAIDFVGNHRVFLERLRALLSLGGSEGAQIRTLIDSDEAIELPSGCSVELELEAKAVLASLFKQTTGADEIEAIYRELKLARGERPSAGELERMGYLPSRLRKDQRHLGWFDFVEAEGDLETEQAASLRSHGAFLRDLETTELTKCFKMVTLEALLEANALRDGLPLSELALRSHVILRRSPELFADVPEELRLDELGALQKKWETYWRKNPIEAWTAERTAGRTWFRVERNRLLPAFEIEESLGPALAELTRELVDYRLAQYRARQRRDEPVTDGFTCRVTWNQTDPILKLPSRKNAQLPEGETDVRVDGSVWTFRLAKEFCNVAKRAGSTQNRLPDLLRAWFGPRAGMPGTAFEVRFEHSPDGLWAEPVQRNVVDLAERRGVIAYPDLRAAAGHASEGADGTERSRVLLPVDQVEPELFAIRVSGTSMDGGKSPMRDGDWALMRLARGESASAMQDRVVLVQLPASVGSQYQIKRLRKQDGQWRLTSDNPAGPTFDASEDTVPIARLDSVFHPEDLGPALGTVLSESELAAAFGLPDLTAKSGRQHGHLFICINQKGMLTSPDRVRFAVEPMRPGETAFVLARKPDGAWRFLGVGRWMSSESCWQIPDVDFATWRVWGSGRQASRKLPDGALGRAQVVADELLKLEPDEAWLEQPNGRRARLLGPAPRGGLRVDGGEGGFEERTISLIDLAWAVVADDVAKEDRTPLDEAVVNRVRYLEGTPKASTKFIDTAWAIAAWRRGKGLVHVAAGGATQRSKVRRADGTQVDASFCVEPVGENASIVLEARGGTGGSSDEQNSEYSEGLELVLTRLRERGLTIADAYVESRDTVTLPLAERRLQLDDRPYPVAVDDVQSVKKALSAAQAKVGRAPGAKGAGNSTKRIRLVIGGSTLVISELLTQLGKP
ncbi:MAG: DEAD/DEAH box helicase family protein [Myxococcales bacterium]|nr:DEAD/DEAH box helicase family protein [Myxococcales bacterium]